MNDDDDSDRVRATEGLGLTMDGRRNTVARMPRSLLAGPAMALLIGIGGCTAPLGDQVARNPASFAAPDPSPLVKPGVDRPLMTGDVVTVTIYKVDSLSGDQTVDGAGEINMPLIGRIRAAGLTTGELEQQLIQAYGVRYLNNPVITVTLKTPVPETVSVAGSVAQPGVYPVTEETTLIRVVAMAHGVTDDANPRRVVVFRQIGGQRMAASFDLASIQRGRSPDPVIYPDDVVVVDGSALTKTFKTLIESLPFVTLFRPY